MLAVNSDIIVDPLVQLSVVTEPVCTDRYLRRHVINRTCNNHFFAKYLLRRPSKVQNFRMLPVGACLALRMSYLVIKCRDEVSRHGIPETFPNSLII